MTSPTPEADLLAAVRTALAEDVGDGDITTNATVASDVRAHGLITQKALGAIYGLDAAETAFALLDPDARFERLVQEGQWREEGGPVLSVEGSARALLTGERTALNFLAHLSGIATMSALAARTVQDTGAKVLDTRKTTPGLRALEKAAVAAGGASNHRAGLYDAILIKENHIAAAGGIGPAIVLARKAAAELEGEARADSGHDAALKIADDGTTGLVDTLEVEVRNLEEIEQALAAGAPRLLLDNMTVEELRAAVAHVDGRAKLEASGNVTLENLRERALTGVDYVSMGSLTHSAPALDLSMIIEPLP